MFRCLLDVYTGFNIMLAMTSGGRSEYSTEGASTKKYPLEV